MSLFQAIFCLVTSLIFIVNARTVNRVVDRGDEDASSIPFSLEEVAYSGRFLPYTFNGTWISPTEIIYFDDKTSDVVIFDVETLQKTQLLDSDLVDFLSFTISLSPSRSYILIGHGALNGFRHSSFKKFAIYDIKHKTTQRLANDEYIALAQWSPIGDDLVYVLRNDIYYARFPKGTTEIRRLTTTGIPGVVYNGVPDWVYEEEVLASARALWFSPDGRNLAFATFNDSHVKDASYFYYGDPGSLEYQYPKEVKIKYPKAGTPNPVVTLNLIDLSNQESLRIDLKAPVDIVGHDNVLYTVAWLSNDSVAVTWTNRIQNHGQMVVYDVDGKSRNLLELVENDGWLEVPTPILHDRYIFMLKYQESGTTAGRFRHVTRFEYADGGLSKETDMSPGAMAVDSLAGLDATKSRIYYFGTAPGEPSHKYLYSVPLDGSRSPTCISCAVLTPEGNNCTYASGSFSTDKSHYALACEGPDVLTVKIYNADGKELLVWQDNESLRKELTNRARPIKKDLYVKANGFQSKVRLLLPPNFDETKSYPMLLQVYGGPNRATIFDRASCGFHSYMTTNRSVIYAWIDGRGSAYKGSQMLFQIYKRMGTVEIQDYITVTKSLQTTYSWIDASRTAIWGWSYGGFSTAMVLATDIASVFKCGISVAPVTSWIYYDSIYTERYMDLPKDNPAGYNGTDVSRLANGFRGKKYLLIHGTGDDNVHYQQSMALAKSLQTADIPFEQMSYTDQAHSLSAVLPHLYHTMDRFWTQCFDLPRTH